MRLQNGQYDFEKITTFDFEIVALIWSSKEVAQKLRLHNAGAAGNRVESSVGAVVDLFASSLVGRRSMANGDAHGDFRNAERDRDHGHLQKENCTCCLADCPCPSRGVVVGSWGDGCLQNPRARQRAAGLRTCQFSPFAIKTGALRQGLRSTLEAQE